MREAPSLLIVPAMVEKGAAVRIVDPQGESEAQYLLRDVEWYSDIYEAANDASLVILLTAWNEFRAIDLKKLGSKMKKRQMVDLRNIYNKKEVITAGFEKYVSVGR